MASLELLQKVKKAMRVESEYYDDEIQMLIDASMLDMQLAGIITDSEDALITRAIITYCRCNFGTPDDYDRLKASYDEQKKQLWMATGYTDWLEDEV